MFILYQITDYLFCNYSTDYTTYNKSTEFGPEFTSRKLSKLFILNINTRSTSFSVSNIFHETIKIEKFFVLEREKFTREKNVKVNT